MRDIGELTTIPELEDAYGDAVRNMDRNVIRRIESEDFREGESDSPLVKAARTLWTRLMAAKLASSGAVVDESGALVSHPV